MKKTIACLTAIATILSLSACSDTIKSDNLFAENNSSLAAEQSLTDVATSNSEEKVDIVEDYMKSVTLNSSDYILNANFTPTLDNVEFLGNPETGAVSSYEELQEYMNIYQNISFVEYEIIDKYTPEEAVMKTGNKVFKHSTTLYKAHIYYDYLNDVPLDLTVDLSKVGTDELQVENNPPYVIGQKIISPLTGFYNDHCVAIPELVYLVYDVNGIDLAYHVENEDICIYSNNYSNINMNLYDSECSLITTTANNPVKFSQKSTASDLTQFIKQDWTERGYDFFDLQNFSNNIYHNQSNNIETLEE